MPATILIAEDEPFIIESLKFLLCRQGHRVCAVNDGVQVIGAVRAQLPDLLILDVMLPGRSGFEVLGLLRADPVFTDLPVLALTAKGQDDDRARMRDLGVDDFVTKPYENTDLMRRVAILLETGRIAAPAILTAAPSGPRSGGASL